MFYDEVKVNIKAGKGGDGAVSFRREKYIPKGGPDGGDGGKGGDVYVSGTRQLSDLADFASTHDFAAENGVGGGGQKLYGKNGADLILRVPVGTRIFRLVANNWRFVTDIMDENRPFRLLTGGKGGLGNVHFATATQQTPRYASPGEPGGQNEFRFELELIADVGIIGLPNAGKSTLISVISEAKPKVAPYPFTTLSPVLGVVKIGDISVVFADIPGLIAGAAQGKGLGHQFLRHIKRTKLLLHLIDATQTDYVSAYQTIRDELTAYNSELVTRVEIVAITKSDIIDALDLDQIERLKAQIGPTSRMFSLLTVSAAARNNIPELLFEIKQALDMI